MMHISASTAPIRVKQKPLHSQLNAECDKHCYNNLFKYLENPPESLLMVPMLPIIQFNNYLSSDCFLMKLDGMDDGH